jgi:hypothetical protein
MNFFTNKMDMQMLHTGLTWAKIFQNWWTEDGDSFWNQIRELSEVLHI